MNAIAQPSAPAAGPQLDRRRVLAGLVDLAIVVAGVFVLSYLFGMVSGGDGATLGRQTVLIGVAWVLFYSFAFESDGGQTPGKKLLKLRVVSADGGPSSTREIAVRTALRVIDGIFVYLVGLIVMLVTGQKRQRLGDLAAGTMVVDAGGAPEPTAAAAPAAVPAAPEVPEGAATPESPDATDTPEAELPAAEPAETKPPIDVGAPLPSPSAPEQPPTPAVTEFNPFSEPAEPVAEPEQVQSEPEQMQPEQPEYESAPVAEEQVEVAPEPAAYEPQVEVAPEPVVEEAAYEAPAYEPQVEVAEPVVEELQGPEIENVPEPVAEEAAFEAPAYEPQVEAAPEPVVEEAAFEAPAQEPQVEIAPEPAAEEEPADEQITMRPMDAPVSGMDLLMAEDEADSPPDGEPPRDA